MAAFIGRYDLQGNRIWFKEFLRGERNAVMALQSDGNLLVSLSEAIFRLNAEDGTLQN